MPRIALLLLLALLPAACSTDEATDLRYPHEPVEVVHDEHGIPHIYATSDADAIWAQGYVMSELRPAQGEIFRLWSQGRRAEIMGEGQLTVDMFVRAMDFLGKAEQNWDKFKAGWPDVAETGEAFAAGINAKYDEYRAEGWPSTMQTLVDAGYDPEPWTGPQVLAVAQLLGFGLAGSPDVTIELTILQALLGPDLFSDLLRFNKPHDTAAMPDFFERVGLASAPAAAGEYGALAEEGDDLGDDAADVPAPNPLDDPRLRDGLVDALQNARALNEMRFSGSNNFSMAADKMEDGIAVIESDTHQGVPIPGPYVLFHLMSGRGEGASGNLDMIGAAFPGAPTVVFGHNGKVAWSPTVGFSDVTDFYWEIADPDDRSRVLRPGGESLPTTSRTEHFKIRQEDGSFRYQSVEVRDIPGHGPILPPEILPLPVPLKISVRWAGEEMPGVLAAVHNMAYAETMEDLENDLRTLKGGTLGFGLGTTEGNGGRTGLSFWTHHPKRDAGGPHKPWFIIPGDRGPHWEGFIPHELLPHWIDPERGYLWSANSDPVGTTFDNDPGNDPLYIGFAYAVGYRGHRLEERLSTLAERGDVTLAELEDVQVDQFSGFADHIIPFFADAMTRAPELVPDELLPYANAVTAWDRHAVPDSFEATIFYTWVYQFMADMLLPQLGGLVDEVGSGTFPLMAPALIHWLTETEDIIDEIDAGTTPFPSESGRNLFQNEHGDTRDELILQALPKAIDHLKQSFASGANGDPAADPEDMTTWQWKRMVFLRSRHSLAAIDPSWKEHDVFWGVGGNVDTINPASFVAYRDGALQDRYILTNASSNRFFWRMEPDGIQAKFQVPWGQSELPESPHYLDLVEDYIHHNFRDFPYTDAEIEAVAKERRVLK